jgi:hypothetical protein
VVPPPDRRRTRRVLASVEARLVLVDGGKLVVRVENLSAVGLCAIGERVLTPGTRCRIALDAVDGTIEADATVVRAEGGRMGLRFDALPYECFERLRTLLLEHADDPAALRDELDDRLGFLGGDAA